MTARLATPNVRVVTLPIVWIVRSLDTPLSLRTVWGVWIAVLLDRDLIKITNAIDVQ